MLSAPASAPTPAPPPYNEYQSEIRLPAPRFKVEPRPEEGHEALPTYTNPVFREALFDLKFEMSSPFEKAHDRSWRSVYTILNGTVLNLYRPKRTTVLGNFAPGESANSVKGLAPGHLIKSYTLQSAEVGLADDYRKKPNVVRVRAETDQFLLSMGSLATMMGWLEALASAIDLSPALEERQLPRYQTIPRRRQQHLSAAQIVSEQEAIMRQQFPHLLQPDDHRDRTNNNTSHTGSTVDVPEEFSVPNPHSHHPSPNTSITSIPTHESDLDLAAFRNFNSEPPRSQQARPAAEIVQNTSSNLSRRNSTSSCSSQSSSEEQEEEEIKAIPPHRISEQANLRYAKRCMPNLTASAPRQSDFLVTGDGKRWKIDWDNKLLMEWKGRPMDSSSLPGYEDALWRRSSAEGLA